MPHNDNYSHSYVGINNSLPAQFVWAAQSLKEAMNEPFKQDKADVPQTKWLPYNILKQSTDKIVSLCNLYVIHGVCKTWLFNYA